MLNVGDTAPAFCSQSDTGETLCLEDFKDTKLVLFFYAKDNTPG